MHVMFLILMISLVAGDFDPDGYLTSNPTDVVVGHDTKKITSIQGSEGIQELADGWFSLGGTLTPDTELTITWEDGSETCKVKYLVREDFSVYWQVGTRADGLFVPKSRWGEVLVKFLHGNLNSPGFIPIEGHTHWYYANQFDVQTALLAGAQKEVKLVMHNSRTYTYTVGLSEMNLLKEGTRDETVVSTQGEQHQITVICDTLEPYPQESRTLILFTGVTSVTGLRNIVVKKDDWVELDKAFIAAVDEVELTVVGHNTQTFKIESWKLLLEGRHEVRALVGTEEVTVSVIGGKQVYPLSPLIYTPESTPGSTMVIEAGDDVNKIEIRASVEGHQVTKIAIERKELRHLDMAGPTYHVHRTEYSADGDTLLLDYQDIWDTSILVVIVTYVYKGTSSFSYRKVRMSTLLLNEKTTFEPANSPALTLTTKVNLEKVTYLSVTSRKELSNAQLATRVTNSQGVTVDYPVGTMSMTRIGLGSTPVFAPVRFLKGKLSEIPAYMLRAEMTQNHQDRGQPSLIDLDPRQMTKTYAGTTDEFHFHTISSRPPLKYLRKRGLWVHFVTVDGNENHVTERIRKWIGNHARRTTIRKLGTELDTRRDLVVPPGNPGVSPLRAPSKSIGESFMDTFSWKKTLGDIAIYVHISEGGVGNDVASVLAFDPFAHFIVLDSLTPAGMPPGTNVFTYDILPVHGLGSGEPSLTPEQSMQQEAFRGVFLGKLEKHLADLGSRNYPKREKRRVRKLRLRAEM